MGEEHGKDEDLSTVSDLAELQSLNAPWGHSLPKPFGQTSLQNPRKQK